MGFLSSFPKVALLLGDRGCDTDWLSEALQDKGIRAYFSERKKKMKKIKKENNIKEEDKRDKEKEKYIKKKEKNEREKKKKGKEGR